ncbi:hypothetical protein TNIN_193061 [Trichonephila inaurata madagascariensis]|uniref:Uncharacterized protein n=1 Tax=Trichonephila inaurata madagascariensis TaxID=2747483 RepID=A0A8X6KEQ5_9ARAC|nr:hypothetical protein TNIN_193061 [Trichonephila inaurata madagascariensis]
MASFMRGNRRKHYIACADDSFRTTSGQVPPFCWSTPVPKESEGRRSLLMKIEQMASEKLFILFLGERSSEALEKNIVCNTPQKIRQ